MEEPLDLFRLVGTTVAASQIFEVTFVLAARLVLKQPDVLQLEDIEPISQSKSFKQPVKGLLRELSQAQSIPGDLEVRVTSLVEKRNRVIHRSFLEFGWPAAMPSEKKEQFVRLCVNVSAESQALSIVFVDMVLSWMKKFPAMSETTLKHEHLFRELAVTIRGQAAQVNAAQL